MSSVEQLILPDHPAFDIMQFEPPPINLEGFASSQISLLSSQRLSSDQSQLNELLLPGHSSSASERSNHGGFIVGSRQESVVPFQYDHASAEHLLADDDLNLALELDEFSVPVEPGHREIHSTPPGQITKGPGSLASFQGDNRAGFSGIDNVFNNEHDMPGLVFDDMELLPDDPATPGNSILSENVSIYEDHAPRRKQTKRLQLDVETELSNSQLQRNFDGYLNKMEAPRSARAVSSVAKANAEFWIYGIGIGGLGRGLGTTHMINPELAGFYGSGLIENLEICSQDGRNKKRSFEAVEERRTKPRLANDTSLRDQLEGNEMILNFDDVCFLFRILLIEG
jgi:hypothetical protein